MFTKQQKRSRRGRTTWIMLQGMDKTLNKHKKARLVRPANSSKRKKI